MIEAPARDVFADITDFLSDDPGDEELLAYHLSDELQERLNYLLCLNRESELTCGQRHELDSFIRADNMISRLKTVTRLRQRGLTAASRLRKASETRAGDREGVVATIVVALPNPLDVITEFLASDPSDDELLAYRFADDLQDRVHYLLDRNGEDELTCEERHELDDFLRANRLVTMLKLNTELRLRGIKP